MEATYCVGTDVDVCRMFDQYLYKRTENVDLSLSIPQSNYHNSNGYDMNDQTFHTPSFGDEDFDIPAINQQQAAQQSQQQQQQAQQQQQSAQDYHHHQQSLQNMQQQQQQQQQQQDGSLGMHDPTGGYQQPIYLTGGPDHGMVNPSYHSPQPNYSMSPNHQQQQQQHGNQLLMIQQQQQQQQQQQMMMSQQMHGPQFGASPQARAGGNSPPVVPGQEPTTSEDSDDSTPHPAMIAGLKRPSPEPADPVLSKTQKKPKVQKKKKKRDPNEPQKPVSAYALFFRDTQAAIKGQNPNASFGEVSKIVASMWDALDSEHKNVYKKKTEAAKKEYLKALAAYRASLVSKGAGEGDAIYANYNYNAGGPQYGGYTPQGAIPSPPTPPTQQQQQQQQAAKKPNMMSPQHQQQQTMMQSPMGHMSMQHMQQQQQHPGYMQQVPQQQMMSHPSPPQHMSHVNSPPMVSTSPPISAPPQQVPTSVAQQQGQMGPPNTCIRHGCPNSAITNTEWEDEYCSNECVVSHCRDVFSNWVVGNKGQPQTYSTVK